MDLLTQLQELEEAQKRVKIAALTVQNAFKELQVSDPNLVYDLRDQVFTTEPYGATHIILTASQGGSYAVPSGFEGVMWAQYPFMLLRAQEANLLGGQLAMGKDAYLLINSAMTAGAVPQAPAMPPAVPSSLAQVPTPVQHQVPQGIMTVDDLNALED